MNKFSLCRLCLSDYNVNVPIFGRHDNNSNNDVLAKIRQFTSIKISESDSLPKYICNSCLKLLELFHQFSVTTANSEIKLLQAISTAAATETATTTEQVEISRIFSGTETLRTPNVREDPESIYTTAEEAASRKRPHIPAIANDSYDNIFYTFRNCFSVEVLNTVNNNNYVVKTNSPNILLPQLLSTVSKNELELCCENIEQTQERPKTGDVKDGYPDGSIVHNLADVPKRNCVLQPCEVEPIPPTFLRPMDQYSDTTNDSDADSLDVQSLNSEIFHSGVGYIHDLDKDIQVTLLDEHLLPLSLVTKKHAPLRWLLDHYCKLSGNTPNQIGFRYNGQLIKDTATACDLDLRNGDMLNVVLLWQQTQVIVAQKIPF